MRPSSTARKRLLNAFVDNRLRECTGSAAAVWLALFRHTDYRGITFVSAERVSELIGLNVRTVWRGLDKLQQLSLVEQYRRGSPTRGPSHRRVKASVALGWRLRV